MLTLSHSFGAGAQRAGDFLRSQWELMAKPRTKCRSAEARPVFLCSEYLTHFSRNMKDDERSQDNPLVLSAFQI